MKANEIVKMVMSRRRVTQIDLLQMMGLKSQSAISGSLNRDMRTSTLINFLNCLNCELVIRDKETGEEFTVSE